MPKLGKDHADLPSFDLRSLRESLGLSQTDMGIELATTQSSIARWEIDGNTPLIYRKYLALRYPAAKSKKRAPAKKK